MLDDQAINAAVARGEMSADTAEILRKRMSGQYSTLDSISEGAQLVGSGINAALRNTDVQRGIQLGLQNSLPGYKAPPADQDQTLLGQAQKIPERQGEDLPPAPMPITTRQPQEQQQPSVYAGAAGQMAALRREYQRTAETTAKQQADAQARAAEATIEGERIAQERAAERNAYGKAMIAQQQRDNAQRAQDKAKFDEGMASYEKELGAELKSLRDTKLSADDRSLSQRIGSAIAIGLGAMSQAWLGGRNNASDLVQAQIDRRIKEQQENWLRRKSAYDDKRQMVREARASYADDAQYKLREQNRGYELGKAQVDNLLASKSLPAEQRAKLEQLRADLDQKQAQNTQALMQQRASTMSGLLAQEDEARAREAMINAKSGGPQQEAPPPGLSVIGGQTPTKEDQKKAAEIEGNTQAMVAKLRELREFVFGRDGKSGTGTELFPTDDAQRAAAMAADLQLAYKDAAQLGALDKGSAEYMSRVIPSDPTGFRQGAIKNKLEALEAMTLKGSAQRLRTLGYARTADQTKQAIGFRPGGG